MRRFTLVACAALCVAAAASPCAAAREATDAELLHGFFDESLVETEAEAAARVGAVYDLVDSKSREVSQGFMQVFNTVRRAVPTMSNMDTVGDVIDEALDFFASSRGARARSFKSYPDFGFRKLAADAVASIGETAPVPLPSKCRQVKSAHERECAQGAAVNRLLLAARSVKRQPPAFFEEAEREAARGPDTEGMALLEEAAAAEAALGDGGASADATDADAFAMLEAGSSARLGSTVPPGFTPPIYVPILPIKVFRTEVVDGPLPIECTERGGPYRVVSFAGGRGGAADLDAKGETKTVMCVHKNIATLPRDRKANLLVAAGGSAAAARAKCSALSGSGYRLLPHDLTPGARNHFVFLCVRDAAEHHFRLVASGTCGGAGKFSHRLARLNLGTGSAPRSLCVMPRKKDDVYERLFRDSWVPSELRRGSRVKKVSGGVWELRFKPLVIINTETPIWYRKHYGRWSWSPDRSEWMLCGDMVVSGGRFAGRTPTKEHVKLIEKIRAHEERMLGYGSALAGLPAWAKEALGKHPVRNGIYTIDSARWFVTDIYARKHNGKWQWSPDKRNWMSSSQHVVRGGRWNGEHAIAENMDLLDAMTLADGGTPRPQPRDSGIREGINEMQDHLKKCYEAHHADVLKPHLNVFGLTGNLGPVTAGFETVMDYDARQVGRFVYGGFQGGLSLLSAGIGVYAGLGWKGNSKGQPLAAAYSQWFNSVEVGVSTPGLEVGFAGIMAFSSNSKLSRFVATQPVCDAVVTACAGVTLAADLSTLPVSVDAASTYYVTHDWVNNDCSKSRNWKTCMAFWMVLSAAVSGGSAGTVVMLPSLLYLSTY